MDARLCCPFIMQVIGPSQSGKTSFVGRLILHASLLFEQPIDELVWFSPHKHLPKEIKTSILPFKLYVKHNLPQEGEQEDEWGESGLHEKEDEVIEDPEKLIHRVYVIDDFGDEAKNNKLISRLYTRGSHHQGITIIQILQNMFLHSKETRTRSLNVHYFVLLRQIRDLNQIRLLASQLAGGDLKQRDGILQAYRDSTARNYGYLLISLHPRSPPELFLRSNIFPDEDPHNVVYQIRGKYI